MTDAFGVITIIAMADWASDAAKRHAAFATGTFGAITIITKKTAIAGGGVSALSAASRAPTFITIIQEDDIRKRSCR